MKTCVYALKDIAPGSYPVKDPRLDEVEKLTGSKKKTYVKIELAAGDALGDAQAILVAQDAVADLILKDLEFVETRLQRVEDDAEKKLLEKLKELLEKEILLRDAELTAEEEKMLSGYGLVTRKPVVRASDEDAADMNQLLLRLMAESGFISYFTTGEKETRAWLVARGTTAWEAAGVIHSDIQRGFIRAEVISYEDFRTCGGETGAKRAGKMRLEQKDYVVQDADVMMFRFNR